MNSCFLIWSTGCFGWYEIFLGWNSELESFVESLGRIVHSNKSKHKAQDNDEDVKTHGLPRHRLSPKIELTVKSLGLLQKWLQDQALCQKLFNCFKPEIKMKYTWPDKWEKTSGKVANEAHEKREVGDKDSKEDCEEDAENSEPTSPDLQFSILRPDWGKWSLGFPLEQLFFNQSTCGIVGKRIGQESLDDQSDIADNFEPSVDVVHDDLLGVLLPV